MISGNRNIYELTRDNFRYLRIEMMDHDCVWKYAEYSMFYIEDATNKYRLHIGGYSGNASISDFFLVRPVCFSFLFFLLKARLSFVYQMSYLCSQYFSRSTWAISTICGMYNIFIIRF